MDAVALFNEYWRLERWIKVQTSFIKFICHKNRFTKEQTNHVMTVYTLSPYEVLQSINEEVDEYEVFKQTLTSKGHTFKDLSFSEGIDYIGLCNTATSLLIKQWNEVVIFRLKTLQKKLKNLAYVHKKLVQIGRTHGIHGEPTSFGYRFALIHSELKRYLNLISELRTKIEVVTFDYSSLYDATTGEELQLFLAEELGLFSKSGNSAYVSRNAYETYITYLNGLSQTINKHSLDISLLSDEEIGEIKVTPKAKQDLLRIDLAAKNVEHHAALHSELSFSPNANHSVLFKKEETCLYEVMKNTLDIVDRFNYVLDNLEPNLTAIEQNLAKVSDSMFSQKLLLYLIKHTQDSREEISKEIQAITEYCQSTENKWSIKFLLGQSKYAKYFEGDVLDKLFDKNSFLAHIDEVYDRIFMGDNKENLLKKILWDEHEIQHAIDTLAEQINKEYFNAKQPITVIAFSERSLVFAGNLILKLTFPISFNTIPHQREDLDIAHINFNKELIHNKRVLIIDMLLHKESNLDRFIRKLYDIGNPLDVRSCALLKTNDITDDQFTVHWAAIECDPDDFYAGFGKNCGSSESFRNLAMIGLVA